ncbi:MAG: autotransporter domain-containing protein, partial [Deltaproteobacteria bacterium]|nr:autotransporter domain-containing protein [Deltaproteobacteria bacterium]
MKCISKVSVLRTLALLTAVLAVFSVQPAFAADFDILSGDWFGNQTLTGSQTGTIEAGGGIDTFGEAVIITNNNNTLTNDGEIFTDWPVAVWIDSTGTGNIVTNNGFINAWDGGDGLWVEGGTVTNTGTILSEWWGVGAIIDGGTVTNSGEILSWADAVQLNGGTLTNNGLIFSNDGGVGVNMVNGTLTNTGTILSEWWGVGAIIDGGTVTNSGEILSWADAVQLNGGTLTNSGLISSTDGGFGVNMTGGTLTNDFGGTISAWSDAVSMTGGTLTNNGFIFSESGDGVYVVDGTVINTTDSIILSSNNGVVLDGNSTLTNSGVINTTFGAGVLLFSGTVTNSGNILSELGYGVRIIGGTLTNSGNILSDLGNGVYMSSGTLTNTGSGSISALGGNPTVWLDGGGTLTNNGLVSTYAAEVGVFINDGTLINNGLIQGNGTFIPVLVQGLGAGGMVINTGTIDGGYYGAFIIDGGALTNTGTMQNNIYTGAVVVNSGTLTNSGTMQGGVVGLIVTPGGTASNTGIIEGGEVGAHVNGGTLTNTNIIQGGLAGVALENNGTLTNSGIISGAWYSIVDVGGLDLPAGTDSTLNIHPGSQLLGPIDLGVGDMDIVNIYGGGTTSYSVDFVGAEQINVFGAGGPAFVNGTTVTVVGQSNGAQRQASNIGATTSSVHNVALSHLNHGAPGGTGYANSRRPLQVAALELAPGMLHVSEPSKAWTEVFTFKRNNEGSATVFSSEHEGSGVVLGYDFDHSNTRIGVLAGFAASSSETDNVKSAKIDTTSMYLGAYGRFHLGFANFTASLIGGMENHENTRYVQYLLTTEKAKGDNTSYFISPSLGLGSAYKAGDGFELRPSVSVSYAMAEYDGYQEKGTTAQNLKVKGYGASSLTSSAQLAVASVGKGGEVELRAGVRARQTEADSVSANLAGVSFKYGAAEDEKISGGYGGVYVRYSLGDRTNFTVDAEMANLGHGDEKEFFGTLG